ncbi:MAG: hypothetical protein ACXACI_08940 [Candidatus Hodarchaeales archaeon]|jgi:hypothetical protein
MRLFSVICWDGTADIPEGINRRKKGLKGVGHHQTLSANRTTAFAFNFGY